MTSNIPSIEDPEKNFPSDECLNDIRKRQLEYFEASASKRNAWRKKNWYYHSQITRLFRQMIPIGPGFAGSVVEAGCSTGELLAELNFPKGTGLDFSGNAIEIARANHPQLRFLKKDLENLDFSQTFDCVICTDTVGSFADVWSALRNLRKLLHAESRLIITHYNYLWEPVLRLVEALGLKAKQPLQHWLTLDDICNLMRLSGLEIIKTGRCILMPVYIPVVSYLFNRFLARLPLLRRMCLVQYLVAKKEPDPRKYEDKSVSVIVPTLDEAGNIRPLVSRLPGMGTATEVIFVDGGSTDGTLEQIKEAMNGLRPELAFKLIHQGGKFGKADAMRKGFDAAEQELFIILDSDLSVAPEDLPKFYLALVEGRGEFINGSRLNYPMEAQAMRYLNNIANHFFSFAFSWLLEHPIRDTLCGTKALSSSNYDSIKSQRSYFGDFDPFGDFDLLFGAAHLSLDIVEMPVRYHNRTYGNTKISRFSHGWLLLKMCLIALKKLKFY